MAKTHFSARIEREDGPAVVVTVRRPTEDEAVSYWQHRQDAEDPRRAAHGGHGDSAAEIMISCVTSVSLADRPTAPARPPAAPGPTVDVGGVEAPAFVPARPPSTEAEVEEAALLGGGAPGDQFRVLREEYPHLPRQLAKHFLALAGDKLTIANAPAASLPEATRKRFEGRRVLAVMVDPRPRKGDDGLPVKGPDGKPVLDGKIVVMTKLSSADVDFMDAEAATEDRRVPAAAALVAQAKAHVAESPPGLLAEYPLLTLYLGQLLYNAAAAKIGGVQGE